MSDKEMHGGHRQRLKDRFLGEGLEKFEKHNMLELLLFYAIPRKDTNPTAHRLMDKFGSLTAVFNASVEELCKVEGVSEHTALLIKLVPEIYRASLAEEITNEQYNSLNKIGKLLLRRYTGLQVETVLLVLLDNRYRILEIAKIGEGSVNQVRLEIRKIVELVIRKNAAMVVLAHNHPNGQLTPSSEDISVTSAVAAALKAINVEFLEHLLIAENSFVPLLSQIDGVFWQRGKSSSFYKEK